MPNQAFLDMLHIPAAIRDDNDPVQGLVRIETTRANNFDTGVVFGWVETASDGFVTLTECTGRAGTPKEYQLHINGAHIVSWRLAELTELPR